MISVAAALYAVRHSWFAKGFSAVSRRSCTRSLRWRSSSLVPIIGLNVATVLIGLTGYTLLLLFANAVTGLRAAPPETIAAADGMGLTPNQVLFKVQLPLSLPYIMAGVRIAVVTVISLETVAAQVVQARSRHPALQRARTLFTTGLIAAGCSRSHSRWSPTVWSSCSSGRSRPGSRPGGEGDPVTDDPVLHRQLQRLLLLSLGHVVLSIIALVISVVVGVTIGAYVGHLHKYSFLAINLGNVLRALPTLALIAVLIALSGSAS